MPTNKVALKSQNSLIAPSNIGSKRPSMTSIVGQITCQVPYLQRQVSMASLLVVRKNYLHCRVESLTSEATPSAIQFFQKVL